MRIRLFPKDRGCVAGISFRVGFWRENKQKDCVDSVQNAYKYRSRKLTHFSGSFRAYV